MRPAPLLRIEIHNMVNKILVSEGLAKAVKIKPNTKYYEELKSLEKETAQNKKGFWKTGFFKN